MEGKELFVDQVNVAAVHMRKIVDLSSYKGKDLYWAYRGISASQSHAVNVGTAIGVAALFDVWKYSLPIGALTPFLRDFVNFGLLYLSEDITNWYWRGKSELQADFTKWLINSTAGERRQRIKGLLGVSEQVPSRFVMLDHTLKVTATNDIAQALAAVEGPPPIVFDAVVAANNVDRVLQGALFVCRDGQGQ